MSMLFLTAHYDDLEVMAGGTAAVNGGHSIVLYPKPEHGKEEESDLSYKILGIQKALVDIGTERELVDSLDSWLRVAIYVKQIICNSPYDSHPEHRRVADIARQIARKNNVDLWFMDHAMPGGYSGTAPRPNHFVKFHSNDKYDALNCYAVLSAADKRAVASRDMYYGRMLGSTYAEGFIIDRSSQ